MSALTDVKTISGFAYLRKRWWTVRFRHEGEDEEWVRRDWGIGPIGISFSIAKETR